MTEKEEGSVAVVTGATRGLGFEIARQLKERGLSVIITGRDTTALQAAGERLGTPYHVVDIIDAASVREFRDVVVAGFKAGQALTLINNAAIHIDREETVLGVSAAALAETFRTNTVGALSVAQAFLPSMMSSRRGAIVNVSSVSGQISSMGFDAPAYRLSKLALNGVTVMLAHAVGGYGIRVNSICPGWVRTEMGGSDAPRSVEEGAADVVWLATANEHVSGKFFIGREIAPW